MEATRCPHVLRFGHELRVQDIDAFVETTRVLPFVHRVSRIPVDVVLAGPGLEEQFFDGTREQIVGNDRRGVGSPGSPQ